MSADLQTLVLNADYRPLSYNPLSLWCWKDALTALFLDRVTLVATYDAQARSPSKSFQIPSVVALKSYVTLARTPAFPIQHLFARLVLVPVLRRRLPSGGLTFDHVVPRSRGGLSTWRNVVAACSPCNLRKANRTPAEAEMPHLTEPARPTRYELHHRQPEFDHRQYHHTWLDYCTGTASWRADPRSGRRLPDPDHKPARPSARIGRIPHDRRRFHTNGNRAGRRGAAAGWTGGERDRIVRAGSARRPGAVLGHHAHPARPRRRRRAAAVGRPHGADRGAAAGLRAGLAPLPRAGAEQPRQGGGRPASALPRCSRAAPPRA